MHAAFDGNPEWRVEKKMADGSIFVIRPITKDDREGLERGFREASPQTLYLRFGHMTGAPTTAMLDYLTNVDQKDHVALVATVTTNDLKDERGIAVARFIRMKRTDMAEAAVVVIDDMQRKGVGRALTYELGRAAQLRGITKLRAEVLSSNSTMRTILERVGAKPVTAEGSDGLIVYELDLLTAAARSRDEGAEREQDAAR